MNRVQACGGEIDLMTDYLSLVSDLVRQARNVGYERLVLSACNPLYSAAQRIIVFARLASVKPLGAARPA